MPVNHAIWTVGDNPQPLELARLPSEKALEDMIVRDPRILSGEWMFIGRQERTAFDGIIDLLAIAPDASLVLIELKRDKTPREIVAQALDYASWVDKLDATDIARMYARFAPGGNLAEDFKKRFGADLDEDEINNAHQIILVAAELDAATERIIAYLNERDIAINVVVFNVFKHGQGQLLSRAWFIDPGETQAHAATTVRGDGEKEPWNGEFYVSYGSERSWQDAQKYGFISGGGGAWYSRTLDLLRPGDRAWVKIPRTGYVGVCRVIDPAVSVSEFRVQSDGAERLAMEVLRDADRFRKYADDPEKSERFVRVEWLDSVDEKDAFDEVGLFGNQNTVCRPETPKWRHTVERLKEKFKKWNIK
jgi:hypothetical protein